MCSSCQRRFLLSDLIAMGIQESSQKPHKDTLTIGMFCKKCNELTIFEIKEMNLIDFACMILEEEHYHREEEDQKENEGPMNRKDKKGSSRGNSKSKITLKEIKEASRVLKSIKTHEEFLEMLGLTREEIEKYNE
jgi:hypothetical protein